MRGLLIDDDEVYARVLRTSLVRRRHEVELAHDGASALAIAARMQPDYALVDLKLGDESGLALVAPLRALRADMQIVLVTGYATFATAVDAIKRGADNYLAKPVTVAALLRVLEGEAAAPEPDAMLPLHRVEWEHIQQAMQECGGNVSAAARLLGMHRRSLQRKLARRPRSLLGLPPVDGTP
ncbi:MAG: response regulator [Proteobacteria bacterium]|jgi:two-component system response regulator RegA|nr:response regulator [Pseudomonadota bacterium]